MGDVAYGRGAVAREMEARREAKEAEAKKAEEVERTEGKGGASQALADELGDLLRKERDQRPRTMLADLLNVLKLHVRHGRFEEKDFPYRCLRFSLPVARVLTNDDAEAFKAAIPGLISGFKCSALYFSNSVTGILVIVDLIDT